MKIQMQTIFVTVLVVFIVFTTLGNFEGNNNEFRAVWLHQTLFDRDKDKATKQVTELFDSYANIGINNIFCYYTLKEENNLDWDFLQLIIDEGHKRNIKIHPVFGLGHEVNLEKAKANWLIKNLDGTLYPGYNVANPEVRKYWLDKISEAMKYNIDGIHLDYMRFPVNQRFSYDAATCTAFKKEYGASPIDVCHDGGSIIWCEWIKWNAKQVTQMVRDIHDMIKKSGKNVLLGVDVFPGPDESKIEIGQDWGTWVNEGLIDFACPMLYINDTDLFTKYLDINLKTADGKCKVYAGIAIDTIHNRGTKPETVVKEVEIIRAKGAQGVVFFSGYSLKEEFRKILKDTVFK